MRAARLLSFVLPFLLCFSSVHCIVVFNTHNIFSPYINLTALRCNLNEVNGANYAIPPLTQLCDGSNFCPEYDDEYNCFNMPCNGGNTRNHFTQMSGTVTIPTCSAGSFVYSVGIWPSQGKIPISSINITVINLPGTATVSFQDFQFNPYGGITVGTYQIKGPWVSVHASNKPGTVKYSWVANVVDESCNSGVVLYYPSSVSLFTLSSPPVTNATNRTCEIWVIPGGVYQTKLVNDGNGLFSTMQASFYNISMNTGDKLTVSTLRHRLSATTLGVINSTSQNVTLVGSFDTTTDGPTGLKLVYVGSGNSTWQATMKTNDALGLRGAGWLCSFNQYADGSACDCNCGIWDPDCSLPNAIQTACDQFHKCDQTTISCVPDVSLDNYTYASNFSSGFVWETASVWSSVPTASSIAVIPGAYFVYLTSSTTILGIFAYTRLQVNGEDTNLLINTTVPITIRQWVHTLELGLDTEILTGGKWPTFTLHNSFCDFNAITTPYYSIVGAGNYMAYFISGVTIGSGLISVDSIDYVIVSGTTTFTSFSITVRVGVMEMNQGSTAYLYGNWQIDTLIMNPGSRIYISSGLVVGSVTLNDPYIISGLLASSYIQFLSGNLLITANSTIINIPLININTTTINKWNNIEFLGYGMICTNYLNIFEPYSNIVSIPTSSFSLKLDQNNSCTKYQQTGFIVQKSINSTNTGVVDLGNLILLDNSSSIVHNFNFKKLQFYGFNSDSISNLSLINGVLNKGSFTGLLSIVDRDGGAYSFSKDLVVNEIFTSGKKARLFLYNISITSTNFTIDGSIIKDSTGILSTIYVSKSFSWFESLSSSGASASSLLQLGSLVISQGASFTIFKHTRQPPSLRILSTNVYCNGNLSIEATPVQIDSSVIVNSSNCRIDISSTALNESSIYLANTVPILFSDTLSYLKITSGATAILKGSIVYVTDLVLDSGNLYIENKLVVTRSFTWNKSSSNSLISGGVLVIGNNAVLTISDDSYPLNAYSYTLSSSLIVNGSVIIDVSGRLIFNSATMTINNGGSVFFTSNTTNLVDGNFLNYGLIQTTFGSLYSISIGTLSSYLNSTLNATQGALIFSYLQLEAYPGGFYYPCLYFNGIYPTSYPGILIDGFELKINTTSYNLFSNIKIINQGILTLYGSSILQLQILEIESGSIFGFTSVSISSQFIWDQYNDDTTIDLQGNISLGTNCNSTIYNRQTGKKYLNCPLVSYANLTLGLEANASIYGTGKIVIPDGVSLSILSAPLSTITPSIPCRISNRKRMVSSTPSGWTCQENLFGDGTTCNCNCGTYDVDCINKLLPITGCKGGQSCGPLGTCIPTVNSTISIDNSGRVESFISSVTYVSQIRNYPSGQIISNTGPLYFSFLVLNDNIKDSVLAQSVYLSGVLFGNNADSLTVMGSLFLGVNFSINKAFVWGHSLPQISMDGRNTTLHIKNTANISFTSGVSSKVLNNISLVCDGHFLFQHRTSFIFTSANFVISSTGVLVLETDISTTGYWKNNGIVQFSNIYSKASIGTFINYWSSSNPNIGIIDISPNHSLSFTSFSLYYDNVPILSSSSTNMTLLSRMVYPTLGDIVVRSGDVFVNSSVNLNVSSLLMDNAAQIYVSSRVYADKVYMANAQLSLTSPFYVSSLFVWQNNLLSTSVIKGSAPLVLQPNSYTTIGNSSSILLLNTTIISQGAIQINDFNQFHYGSSGVFNIYHQSVVSINSTGTDFTGDWENGTGIYNNGTINVLQSSNQLKDFGKIVQTFSGTFVVPSTLQVKFTGGFTMVDMFNTDWISTTRGGISILSGTSKQLRIDKFHMNQGTGKINTTLSPTIGDFSVKGTSSSLELNGISLQCTNFSFEDGVIGGDSSIDVFGVGYWQRSADSTSNSRLYGSGDLNIHSGGHFIIDSLSSVTVQSIENNNIIVSGTISFTPDWFKKSSQIFNIKITSTGVFDASSFSYGNLVLANIENMGSIMGPFQSSSSLISWNNVVLIGGNLYMGPLTSFTFKKLTIRDTLSSIIFENSDNSNVLLSGNVSIPNYGHIDLSGSGTVDLCPNTTGIINMFIDSLTIHESLHLIIHKNCNLVVGTFNLRSNLTNYGVITISSILRWGTPTVSSFIDGDGKIVILNTSTFSVEGSAIDSSLGIKDQTIVNYGYLEYVGTFGISSLNGILMNYGNTSIRLSSNMDLGIIENNKGGVISVTADNSIPQFRLVNDGTFIISGRSTALISNLHNRGTIEILGTANLNVLGNSILSGFISVTDIYFHGWVKINKFFSLSALTMSVIGGSLEITAGENYQGIFACVSFENASLVVNLLEPARHITYLSIPLYGCVSSNKRLYLGSLGNLDSLVITNFTGYYDNCEVPVVIPTIQSGYLAVFVSTQYTCSNSTLDCSNPNITCSKEATCQNIQGSYECVCNPGFAPVYSVLPAGRVCSDIDECSNSSICGNKECLNLPGSYQCLDDINECDTQLTQKPNPCYDSLRTCVNTQPGYYCTACPVGYEADTDFTCKDVDECSIFSLNGCGIGTTCVNTLGGYICDGCPVGMTKQNDTCVPIDACSFNMCQDGRVCKSLPLGYKCEDCGNGLVNDGDTHCLPAHYCINGDCSQTECLFSGYYENGACMNRTVVPVLECVSLSTSNSLIAHFGYQSFYLTATEVITNIFTVDGSTQNIQPTVFYPSRNYYQFEVEFNQYASWRLDSQTVTATSSSLACNSSNSPNSQSSSYKIRTIAAEDTEFVVALISTQFSETVEYHSSCREPYTSIEKAQYNKCDNDALCIDDTLLGYQLVSSWEYTAVIQNTNSFTQFSIAAEIISGSTTAQLSVNFSGYVIERTLNNDPISSTTYLIVCFKDIKRNTKQWNGEVIITVTNPNYISVRLLLNPTLPLSLSTPLIMTNDTNTPYLYCQPYNYSTPIPQTAECHYLSLPASSNPIQDYQKLVASKSTQIASRNNTIVVAVILSQNGGDSWLRGLENSLFSNWKIRFSVINTYGAIASQFYDINPSITTGCNSTLFGTVKQGFETEISSLGQSQYYQSQRQMALSYALSDVWQDCMEYANSLLEPQQVESCSTSECCLFKKTPRVASQTAVSQHCSYSKCSTQNLNLLGVVQSLFDNNNNGCEQETQTILNRLDTQTPLFRRCYIYTYGQSCSPNTISELSYDSTVSCGSFDSESFCLASGNCTLPCSNSSDCPSNTCFDYGTYKSCVPFPKTDTLAVDQLVKCLTDSINEYIILYIKEKLSSTGGDFNNNFLNQIVLPTCQGPPTFLPLLSEPECTGNSYCNWASCEISSHGCTEKNCLSSNIHSNGYYCAHCYHSTKGEICPEVSKFQTCAITDPIYSNVERICTLSGFSFNPLLDYPCQNQNASIPEVCNPPEFCADPYNCSSICYFSKYTDFISCTSSRSNAGTFFTWNTWTTPSGSFGLCTLDVHDSLTCDRRLGTWRPGRIWLNSYLTTKEECERSGICREGYCDDGKCLVGDVNFKELKGKVECEGYGQCSSVAGCLVGFPNSDGRCVKGTWWTPLGCIDPHNKSFCENWIELNNQFDCENVKLCRDTSVFNPVIISRDNYLLSIPAGWTNKSQSECESCGGKWESVYTWTKGKWIPNVFQNYTWKQRQVLPYTWEDVFDSNSLNTLVQTAQSNYISSILKTELLCKYSQISDLLYRLACDCNNAMGQCSSLLSAVSQVPVGFYQICKGIDDSSVTDNFAVISTSPQITYGFSCLDIAVSKIDISQFQTKKTDTLSTAIVPTLQRHKGEFVYIKNNNGIVIGKLVGDGFGFSVPKGSINSGVSICIKITTNEVDFGYVDLVFTSIDFKAFTPSNRVIPLTGNSSDIYSFCFNYTGAIVILFPAVLLTNYQTITYQTAWSTADLILIYLALVIYFILFFYGIFNLFLLFQSLQKVNFRAITDLPKLILIITCLFLLFRIIYFIILPFGVFESSPALQTIFSELPILIFFSSFVFQVVRWAEIYHYSRKLKNASLMPVAVALNIFLYFVFFLVFILYYTIPSGDLEITCTTPDSEISQVRLEVILSLTYKVFFIVSCIVCSTGYLFYGLNLVCSVTSSKEVKNKQKTIDRLRKLVLLVVFITASLMANAIMLILNSTGEQIQTAWGLITFYLVVEILPVFAIFRIYGAGSALSHMLKTDGKSSWFRTASRTFTRSRSRDDSGSRDEEGRSHSLPRKVTSSKTSVSYSRNSSLKRSTTEERTGPRLKIKASGQHEMPLKPSGSLTDHDPSTDIELKPTLTTTTLTNHSDEESSREPQNSEPFEN